MGYHHQSLLDQFVPNQMHIADNDLFFGLFTLLKFNFTVKTSMAMRE